VKKPTLKRLLLGLLQHLLALGIMIAVAGILFNSYVAVESMNGTNTYYLSPMDTEPEFEDSEVFREIFTTAVSDITRLVVIKGQVETDGVFDANKTIDITQFANRTGKGNDCPVTAQYSLDDLIKWGKYGIEYSKRPMSMTEFVNYFGEDASSPSNFGLDENAQLFFRGFAEKVLTEEEALIIQQAMDRKTQEQLEDMVFSYIVTEVGDEISVSREDDGALTVYVPMISNRYSDISGEPQLVAHADNWIDYIKLQNNLADTILNLTVGYQQYQNCNHLYLENKSNLKYVVRMNTEEGVTSTYTNVSELENQEDSVITDFFGEYRRYLIYYPDSLEFTGNTSMNEEEIYAFLNEYEYAYPETTHIWIGVDTTYPIEGDAFYNANEVFRRIVPNISKIVSFCIVLGVIWIGLCIYLTVTAGVALDSEGNQVHYLNGIDHFWTEILFGAAWALIYGANIGYRYLMGIADMVYRSHSGILMTEKMTPLYQYGSFAAFGFVVSMLANMLWYSLVRRIKSRNLWKCSFCYFVFDSCRRGIRFIFTHRNTAVSILLPYNIFLLVNLLGIVFCYMMKERRFLGFMLLVLLVAVDSLVGIMIFRNRAEQVDIVEGIKRIRDGEVDYKLDAESLHGDNREMADAVNNIGEGIRKAVSTSMKDEQMKTDLITNVSHDIKTPLTSIINYVDLLKRLKIEEEPAKSYIEILDGKSQRLKQLTDDLVEASKISSGSIELNREKLNLAELLNQAIGEFSEKFEDNRLQVIFNGSQLKANIFADSRRMWRVIENLFNNVCKYALEGTRIYIDLTVVDGRVDASIKNISAVQMNIKSDELTERFIRGDSARTTEGSGLGLYIAKSLTRVQGGEFNINVDGDLFKVLLQFLEYVEKAETEIPEEETVGTV